MKIYIGSDHAGFKTKQRLLKFLEKKKAETVDFGAFDEESSDYPDFAQKVARAVANDPNTLGVLVCGTGIGMCIAANKVKGVRAANPFDEYTAGAAREHNHANVICLGGRAYSKERAVKILDSFLKAKESREARHKSRVEKISEMEKEC